MSDAATPETPGTAQEDMRTYGALEPGEAEALKKMDRLFPTEEPAHPPAEATQDVEEDPPVEEPQTAEPELEDEGSEPSEEVAEPSDEPGELPRSLTELAEAYEEPVEEFLQNFRVPVKVNGVASEVSFDEVIRGYQKGQDYSQRMDALSEERRTFESERSQVQQAWQQRIQQAEDLYAVLTQQLSQGPSQEDLDRLLEEDPQAYMRTQAQLQRQQGALQAAYQRIQAARQQASQEQLNHFQAYRQEQTRQLIQRVNDMDLSDPTKQTEFETSIRKYLRDDVGYSDQEVQRFFGDPYNPWDHRQMLVIRDALRYRALEKGKKVTAKKLSAKPPVVKPGTKPGKGQQKGDRIAEAKRRLKRTGSDEAALSVIDTLIPESYR